MTKIKTELATTPDEATVLPSLDRGVGNHTAVLRVVIADDHPLFRQAVRGAIERHPGLALIGEAEDGQQALELIDTLQPDVAVLDHRMPTLSGAEVCAELRGREHRPATALLMLSAFEDADLVWGAVSSGAAGYIDKGASPDAICAAIEEVGRGGIAFTKSTSAGMSEGFARHLNRDDPATTHDC